MRVINLTLLFLLAALNQIQAAEVVGQVADATGRSIPGCQVELQNIASGETARTESDKEGNFSFEELKPGQYRVVVRAEGFSEEARTVAIGRQSETLTLDFVLQIGTIAASVTVTANRGERDSLAVPLRTQSLESSQFLDRNPTSPSAVLERAVGITPVNSGPFVERPRLRGLDSTRVLVLVDGERLNNARTATDRAGVETSLVDTGSIERIEVASGTGSVLYGTDALAGTINLITRKPRPSEKLKFHGGFDGFYSSNENGRRGTADVGLSGKRFAFRFSGTLERYEDYESGGPASETSQPLHDAGILVQRDTADQLGFNFNAFPEPFNAPFTRSDTLIRNSSGHGSNLRGSGLVDLGAGQTVSFNYIRRRMADVGFADFDPPIFFQRITIPFSNLDKISGSYQKSGLTPWFTNLRLNLYHQRQDRLLRNDFPVQFPAPTPQTFFPVNIFRLQILSDTEQQVRTTGLDFQSRFLLTPRNVLTAGFTVYRDRSEDQRTTISRLSLLGDVDLGMFGPQPNVLPRPIPLGPPTVDNPVRVPDAFFQDVGFFLQDEWELHPKVRLVGALRVDHYRVRTEATPGYEIDSLIEGANPPIDPSTLPDLEGDDVSRNALTGNLGFVFRPNRSVSLSARYGRSYRHPNLEELFFAGPATIGSIVPNVTVRPETGDNFDLGLKLRRGEFQGSVTYFNNTFHGFISAEVVAERPGGSISQSVNFTEVRIQGIEGDFELPRTWGPAVFTFYGNLGYTFGEVIEGSNPLTGASLDGTPQDNITPFKAVSGVWVTDRSRRFWAEYSNRIHTRVDRVAQTLLDSPFLIAQDLFGLNGFTIHRVGWGIKWRGEDSRIGLRFGIENLGNKFYREQFQFAPARGRTFTVGLHIDAF